MPPRQPPRKRRCYHATLKSVVRFVAHLEHVFARQSPATWQKAASDVWRNVPTPWRPQLAALEENAAREPRSDAASALSAASRAQVVADVLALLAALDSAVEAVDELDASDAELADVDERSGAKRAAKCGVEAALLDLLARVYGVPLWQLFRLDGAQRKPLYYTVAMCKVRRFCLAVFCSPVDFSVSLGCVGFYNCSMFVFSLCNKICAFFVQI